MLELVVVLVEVWCIECVLKILLLILEVFRLECSYFVKDGVEIGLWGFIYEINNGFGLDVGIIGWIVCVVFK